MFSGGIKWEHWLLSVVNIPLKLNAICGQFYYLILPENTRNPEVFKVYQMGTLARNGLSELTTILCKIFEKNS